MTAAPRFRTSTPVLASSDYARSRAFYCDGLGFGVGYRPDERRFLKTLVRKG